MSEEKEEEDINYISEDSDDLPENNKRACKNI